MDDVLETNPEARAAQEKINAELEAKYGELNDVRSIHSRHRVVQCLVIDRNILMRLPLNACHVFQETVTALMGNPDFVRDMEASIRDIKAYGVIPSKPNAANATNEANTPHASE
jgi:hypothetical protein